MEFVNMLRFNLLNFAAGACLLVGLTFVAGAFYASLGHSSSVELATITGKVTLHGQPQPNLSVDFVPIGGGRGSEGRTDLHGCYQAIYTRDKAGALVGQQQVIISVPEVLDSHLNIVVPRKQLLTADVEVHSGANQFDFDLAN
ncbi:MAG TPA: hypothetical protein VGJ04_11355 [Pirellulales bacterium]|jgi:hypothetical protein